MPSFIGTNKQFRKYLGPNLRNIVQHLTRSYKKERGVCQHCPETESLEAAHVSDKSRNDIIDLLLEKYTFNGLLTVNIEQFVEEFKKAHDPIESSILVLCKKCHKAYDMRKDVPTKKNISPDVFEQSHNQHDMLPITLFPTDLTEFKTALLAYKKATIETINIDGTTKQHIWNASRFSTSSDLYGNLRSRPQFRKDNWKKLGIKEIHVKILK